jgi:hypothetical protein
MMSLSLGMRSILDEIRDIIDAGGATGQDGGASCIIGKLSYYIAKTLYLEYNGVDQRSS